MPFQIVYDLEKFKIYFLYYNQIRNEYNQCIIIYLFSKRKEKMFTTHMVNDTINKLCEKLQSILWIKMIFELHSKKECNLDPIMVSIPYCMEIHWIPKDSSNRN